MRAAIIKLGYESASGPALSEEVKNCLEGALLFQKLVKVGFKANPEHEGRWHCEWWHAPFIIDLDKITVNETWKFIEIQEIVTDSDELEVLGDKEKHNRVDGSVYNKLVNVAVGGSTIGLDTVQVWEDLCTEELQRLLNKGWRIVAVCVQPNQRRPDYVMGKVSGNE